MIEVHVFNAFLQPAYKSTTWFHMLDFINGLVAPSFLFISGFIFVLLSFKKAEEYRKFGPLFWKQIRRILTVWFIAYVMHLPFYTFRMIVEKAKYEDWLRFFQSDVLHVISLGLMILLIASIFFKTAKSYQLFNILLGLAMVFVTPFIWEIDFTKHIHPFFAGYMNPAHHSIFPVFPWMGFMLLGGALAPIYQRYRNNDNEHTFIKWLMYVGITLIIITIFFKLFNVHIPHTTLSTRANPFFFFQRLGIVFVLLCLCWFWANIRNTKESFVIDASKESLIIYLVHIEIIYGAFFNYKSIAYYINESFNVWQCCVATILMIVQMILLAKVWNGLKTRYPKLFRYILYAVWIIFIYKFVIEAYFKII